MSKPRPIEHDDIGNFGIDDSNNLYWNNKKIRAESSLSGGAKLWLGIVTLLGVIGTLSGIAGGAVTINKEFCFVESKSCPPENQSTIINTPVTTDKDSNTDNLNHPAP